MCDMWCGLKWAKWGVLSPRTPCLRHFSPLTLCPRWQNGPKHSALVIICSGGQNALVDILPTGAKTAKATVFTLAFFAPEMKCELDRGPFSHLGHLSRPRRPFWVLQALWRCRWWGITRWCSIAGVAGGEQVPPSPRGWYYGSIIGVILGSILGSIFGSILGLPFGSILGSILDSIYGSTRPKSKVFRLEILILLIWTNVPQDKCCLDKCCGDNCNLLYMFTGPFV